MIATGARIRDGAERYPAELALLLMHGKDDPICHVDDTEAFYARLACTRKELVVWPGMKHEIHNEPERAKVLETATRFLGI
jgi:alpha-beta hydrolase superfamily lysophospholipase